MLFFVRDYQQLIALHVDPLEVWKPGSQLTLPPLLV